MEKLKWKQQQRVKSIRGKSFFFKKTFTSKIKKQPIFKKTLVFLLSRNDFTSIYVSQF